MRRDRVPEDDTGDRIRGPVTGDRIRGPVAGDRRCAGDCVPEDDTGDRIRGPVAGERRCAGDCVPEDDTGDHPHAGDRIPGSVARDHPGAGESVTVGPFGRCISAWRPVSGQRGWDHGVEVGADHLRAQPLARAAERHRGQRPGLLRGRRDPRVDRRDDLGAVRPVHLGAVVLPGVVAGRNHQPGRGAQVADREGQYGRRDQGAERQDAQAAQSAPRRPRPRTAGNRGARRSR